MGDDDQPTHTRMTYPHRVRIGTPGPLTGQDRATGKATYGPATIVYEGPADVQDEPAVIKRDPDGRVISSSDARVYLARPDVIAMLTPGLHVWIDWRDGTPEADAVIVEARRLDGAVYLNRV